MKCTTRILAVLACLTAIIPTTACGTQNGGSTDSNASSEAEIKEMTKRCVPKLWTDYAEEWNSNLSSQEQEHALRPKLSESDVKYLDSDCKPKWMHNLDKDKLYTQVKDKVYRRVGDSGPFPSVTVVIQLTDDPYTAEEYNGTFTLPAYQNASSHSDRKFKGDADSLTLRSIGPIDDDGFIYDIYKGSEGTFYNDRGQDNDMDFVLDLTPEQIVICDMNYGSVTYKAS